MRDIFTSSGYDVTDSFRHDLVAERNSFKTYIKLSYDPDITELREFACQLTEGEGLYVIAAEATDEFLRQAKASGIKVWTRDDMALKIGRAVIADVEGTTADLDLLGQFTEKPLAHAGTVSRADEVAKEAINAIFGTGSSPHVDQKALDNSFISRCSRTSTPSVEQITEVQYYRPGTLSSEPVAEEPVMSDVPVIREKVPLEAPLSQGQSVLMDLRSSPVNVPKERAMSIAVPHVRGGKAAVLKFVPFWKYSYSLGVEHRYKSKIIDISGDGTGCLNALNGNNEKMDLRDIHDSVMVPDVEYDVKVPVTTEEDACKGLLDTIIAEYTRDLRFDNAQGDAIISEHKRFKPAASDIDLNVELVYVPVWEIKGQRNSVEINASSGEVLRNPVDNDVEFV
ncbi:MAG: hypothetical protein QCH31_09295 [Methanolobus sp.]|nr:hypothetical protein [Methanolobus sp.]